MSAWAKLLAASSLAIGTAWQLISSPKTDGSGGTVFYQGAAVVVDSGGYTVHVETPNYSAAVDANELGVVVYDPTASVFVDGTDVAVSIPNDSYLVKVTP